MAIKVGSAKIDERGKATGGALGDNNGREVATENYYLNSKGWYLFRPKDVKVADAIADAMLCACNNDNIGYDQSNRLGVITMLKKYGKMSKIKEKTESDCSSLVRGCCIEAGFDPGNFNTASQPAALDATKKFEKKVSVTSGTILYNGDILVTKTKGHTVVVVSGNPRNSVQQSGIKIDSALFKDTKVSGTYEVANCGALNLRGGAKTDTDKNIITTMKAGEKVSCYGYYNKAANGTKWLYIVYKDSKGQNHTGYASSKYLKKK